MTHRTRLLLAALAAVVLLAVAGMAGAAHESNNAVSATDTAGYHGFSSPKRSVLVINDGSDPAWVRVWLPTDTIAAVTTATAGAFKLAAGERLRLDLDEKAEPLALGYQGVGYICDTSGTATLRIFAK